LVSINGHLRWSVEEGTAMICTSTEPEQLIVLQAPLLGLVSAS
jgi:hypothetical protein